jgi:hypothetical protein
MLANNLLGKHKALRRMEISYILPVEMVIIPETGILCITFGIYNWILLLRILAFWCPSSQFSKRKQCFSNWLCCCSDEGLRRHLFSSFLPLVWNQYEPHTLSSDDENRIFPRMLGSLLNIGRWTNSRNPVILNVLCGHQNALGLTGFC